MLDSSDLPARSERRAVESQEPLSQWERLIVGAIFSGLALVLVLAAAVMVDPYLVDDFNPYWPVLAGIGFLSTLGGFWWLWWRPR